MRTLFFATFLAFLPNAGALRCFQCNDVANLSNCFDIVECTTGQQCFTQRYKDGRGVSHYNMGCLNPSDCHQNTYSSNLVVGQSLNWISCCKGDNCNINYDETGHTKASSGMYCYNCPNVAHPGDCKHVIQCKSDEECITYSNDHGRHPSYALGCSSKTNCEMPNSILVIGKRSTPDTCKSCCNSTSYCNDKLCAQTGLLNSTPTSTVMYTPTHAQTTSSTTRATSPTSTTSTIQSTLSPIKSTTQDVFSGAHLVVVPSNQTVEIGSMADFECSFDTPMNHPVNMSWIFTDKTGHVSKIYESTNANPPEVFIDVKNVTSSDVGVYTCQAKLGSHTLTANGRLDLPETSITTSPSSTNISSWILKVYPSNQTVPIGETAFMLCQFDPVVREPVTMTWTFTDKSGNTTRIFSEGEPSSSMTFYVKELDHSDEGLYTCQAIQGSNVWTATSKLFVQG